MDQKALTRFEPDAERVDATFDKEILKITVPKCAVADEKIRKIQVKGS